MEPKHHLKGLPVLGEFVMPKIEAEELAAILLGAIDAAKERSRKEVLKEVFTTLDKLRGKDGCVAVDVVKRALAGYFEI